MRSLRKYRPHYTYRKKRRHLRLSQWLTLIAVAFGLAMSAYQAKLRPEAPLISCTNPYIIDGDTIDCNGLRIRLAGIDAPEMPGHCKAGRKCTAGDPHAARDYLSTLTRDGISCTPKEVDHYGRTIARCETAAVKDVSCAMLAAGHAVRRYGYISCFMK